MKPLASIAHATATRLRIRIQSKRGDDAFFGRVHQSLVALPGVRDVRVNARTSSVLLLHDEPYPPELDAALDSSDLFELGREEPVYEALLDRTAGELARLNDGLKGLTRGGLDVPSGLFVLFLLAALTQAARGQVLGSASSLLWYAYETLRHRGRASP